MSLVSLLRLPLQIVALVSALLVVSPSIAQVCDEPVAQEPPKPTTSVKPES